MLELVRRQQKVLAKATGCESDYEVLSMAQIRAPERKENYDIGKYYNAMQYSIKQHFQAALVQKEGAEHLLKLLQNHLRIPVK